MGSISVSKELIDEIERDGVVLYEAYIRQYLPFAWRVSLSEKEESCLVLPINGFK